MTVRSIDWASWYGETETGVRHLERAYSTSRILDLLGSCLPRGSKARVLELGCAPGRWLAWIRRELGAQALGLELEASGVALTRSLYPDIGLVRADAFHIPLAAGCVDGVYSIGLIEHFEDPRPIMREAHRVLRPSGVSAWIVPNIADGTLCRWHWRTFRRKNFEAHRPYRLEDLVGLLEATEWTVIRAEHNGVYLPHLQRLLGGLPWRTGLKGLEHPRLASNLAVIARRRGRG